MSVKDLIAPEVHGASNLAKDRPALYVGNHTLTGVLDVPHLAYVLRKHGIRPRGLGDRRHFLVPGWAQLLTAAGIVEGTREICSQLMEAGEHIVVYPGGGREVMKRKGEKYQLLWAERVGFARMAIKHAYPIVPFASVGAEECYDIVLDAGDLMRTPVGGALKRLGMPADLMPPLLKGWKGTPLPKPQKFYFWFGEPIDTTRFGRRWEEDGPAQELRDEVKAAVNQGIEFLLATRELKQSG